MYVKLMSGENIPDSDPRKQFTLIDKVESVEFDRESKPPLAHLEFANGRSESFELHGNVYILNDMGKTIEKFGVHPL